MHDLALSSNQLKSLSQLSDGRYVEYVRHLGDLYSGPLFRSTFDLAGYAPKCMINIHGFSFSLCHVCLYVCVCVCEHGDEKEETHCGLE